MKRLIENVADLKREIYLSFIIYISSVFAGLITSKPVLSADVVGLVDSQNVIDSFINILTNNIKVQITVILGAFFISIPTVYVLLMNGMTLGYVLSLFVYRGEMNLFIFSIMPHGFFEIPGLLISSAVGFRLFYIFYKNFFGYNDISFSDYTVLIKLTLFSFSLVIIGAVIEASITQILTQQYFEGGYSWNI